METLSGFMSRINSFNRTSLPSDSDMTTNAGLSAKIDINGKMLKFKGNTIVFSLPEDFIKKADALRQKLYESCGDFLAEPIDCSTFHITLHDLVNGSPSDDVDSEIIRTEKNAIKILNDIINEDFCIKLRTNAVFNMVNTSVVLGFEPVDEASHNKLMEYYERFQDIVFLNYPLTPHMTLAYYKPCVIGKNQIANLQKVIDCFTNQKPETIELKNNMLSYMVFEDMNNYSERFPCFS